MKISSLFSLLRIHNWIKNLFVFAPLLFVGKLFDGVQLLHTASVFISFCAATSFVYILNDYVDRESDKQHPTKKKRLIASKAISSLQGALIALVALIIGLVFGFAIHTTVGWIVVLYIGMNIWYSLQLKQIIIIDVIVIAIGFVLRIIAGAVIIAVTVSPWIIMCGFFLTLFLAISKRRQELLLMKKNNINGEVTRTVLEKYSIEFLDKLSIIILSTTLLSYVLYSFNAPISGSTMMYSVPFVVYGMLRYLYLMQKDPNEDDPIQIIIHDAPLLISILLWVMSVSIILYY